MGDDAFAAMAWLAVLAHAACPWRFECLVLGRLRDRRLYALLPVLAASIGENSTEQSLFSAQPQLCLGVCSHGLFAVVFGAYRHPENRGNHPDHCRGVLGCLSPCTDRPRAK